MVYQITARFISKNTVLRCSLRLRIHKNYGNVA